METMRSNTTIMRRFPRRIAAAIAAALAALLVVALGSTSADAHDPLSQRLPRHEFSPRCFNLHAGYWLEEHASGRFTIDGRRYDGPIYHPARWYIYGMPRVEQFRQASTLVIHGDGGWTKYDSQWVEFQLIVRNRSTGQWIYGTKAGQWGGLTDSTGIYAKIWDPAGGWVAGGKWLTPVAQTPYGWGFWPPIYDFSAANSRIQVSNPGEYDVWAQFGWSDFNYRRYDRNGKLIGTGTIRGTSHTSEQGTYFPLVPVDPILGKPCPNEAKTLTISGLSY